MEEVKINATKDQIKELKSSVIWNDIVNELESWKHGFDMEAHSIVDDAAEHNPSTASVLMHLGDISGREKAVNYMFGILDVFLGILGDEDEIEGEEEEKEE